MKNLKFFAFTLFLGILNLSYSQNGWILQNTPTTVNLFSISFINNNTGYCSGDNGVLLRTTNGGTNWNMVNTGYNHSFDFIRFFDINTGIIGSKSGTGYLVKTTNGGINWSEINIGSANGVIKVEFITPFYGYALRSTPSFFKTTNGGISWNEQSAFLSSARDLLFVNSNTAFSCGSTGGPFTFSRIYGSNDSGRTWGVVMASPDSMYYSRVYYKTFDNSVFCMGSFYGCILKNGVLVNGAGTYVTYRKMYFSSMNTGWAGGNQLIKTIDGGNNWFPDNPPNPEFVNDIIFMNDSLGWIACNNGKIYKTTNGGYITNVTENQNNDPKEFSLTQNYPNPFNPQTKIKFSVPKASFTKLIIYDLLGREVATLVNEELKPGTYETDWDASNYSSGVYFYKLVAGDFTETKKMVLMK